MNEDVHRHRRPTLMDHLVKAGDVHWVDAKVTHALRNAGSQEGVLVEVELK